MTLQVGAYYRRLTEMTLLDGSSPFICTSSSLRKRDVVITKPTQLFTHLYINDAFTPHTRCSLAKQSA